MLRAELAADAAEMARLERLCTTGCALAWVWLFGVDTQQWWLLAFIPTLVALFGAVRSWALYRSILCIAAYTMKLEAAFAVSPMAGWEHFIRNDKSAPTGFGRDHKSLRRVSNAFWIVLILITIGFGVFYAVWREEPPRRRGVAVSDSISLSSSAT